MSARPSLGLLSDHAAPPHDVYHTHGVEIADALIAAAARVSGMPLWTLDRRHYPMADIDFFSPPRG